ncbi:unnamed protein product, partial [Scytosiphon promiscuus]
MPRSEGTDSLGRTRLFNATCLGRAEFVEMLLESGCSIATRDSFKNTPVHGAAYGGSVSVMELIVAAGGDLSDRNGERFTPMMIAAQKGHIDLFHWLLAQGKSDVNDSCVNGMNSLFLATDYSNADMVKAVLKAGGDFRARTVDGWMPLHAATRVGNLRMMRALMRAGTDPEARGLCEMTPLHVAANEGKVLAARELMRHGACPLAVGGDGASALYTAVVESHPRLAVEMLNTLERRDEEGKTVFPDRASLVGRALFSNDKRFMSLVHGAVYGLEVKSLSKLLSMGALDPYADKGGDEAAARFIDHVTPGDSASGIPPKNPVLKACVRRMLARRVAFTAPSWLWPDASADASLALQRQQRRRDRRRGAGRGDDRRAGGGNDGAPSTP